MWRSVKEYIFAVCKWWWVVAISIFFAGIEAVLIFWQGFVIPIWVGIAIVILGLFLAQFLAFHEKSSKYHKLESRLLSAEQIESILQSLAYLRSKGVELRNSGIGLDEKDKVDRFIEAVTRWNEGVLSQIEKLSPSEATIFGTLDWVEFQSFEKTFSPEHDKYLRILSQRLISLKNLVLRYSQENVSRRSKTLGLRSE